MTDHAKTLAMFNRWRRGAEIPQPDPKEIGKAIDAVLAELRKLRAQHTTQQN